MEASTKLLVQDFTTQLHDLQNKLDLALAENRILQQKLENRISDTGNINKINIFCSFT